MEEQPNNPLHGVKLADIVEHLVNQFGWDELASKININCFKSNPSIKSSLKFLRKTPWARDKVERLYLRSIGKRIPQKKRVDNSQRAGRSVTPTVPVQGEETRLSPWDAAKKRREARE